ncbi:MAG: endonuclease/exonuclease/phosphatase family protein [Candidatus Promineofilum sp.]|nr:endonuclease/exonuclease/phosphatase family protein [Promineifilum sp.]
MDFSNGLNDLVANVLPQTENYSDPAGPLFTGEVAQEPAPAPDEMVVVSYNLRYGEAITETLQAFQEISPLPDADIILLQEMDEAGVAAIAGALRLNYVYYPASVAEDGDDFGNAILARWPITEPAKLILPGLHPLTGQQRTATRAVVQWGDVAVLVYGTHIEVATTPVSMRQAQFEAILADIPNEASHVIVGGDFNTVTGRGVKALVAQFEAGALDHATAGLGPTFTRFGLRPSATDHIFTRGFRPLDAGVLGDVTASDHFPVWARLSLD